MNFRWLVSARTSLDSFLQEKKCYRTNANSKWWSYEWESKAQVTSSNLRVTSSNSQVRRLKARVERLK